MMSGEKLDEKAKADSCNFHKSTGRYWSRDRLRGRELRVPGDQRKFVVMFHLNRKIVQWYLISHTLLILELWSCLLIIDHFTYIKDKIVSVNEYPWPYFQ